MLYFRAIVLFLATFFSFNSATAEDQATKAAVAFTEHYFSLRAEGKLEEAYELFNPGLRAKRPFDAFSSEWRGYHLKGGKFTSLDIRKVTWYSKEEGENPNYRVVVDYRAAFERLPIVCGYLVWEMFSGTLRLAREEINVLEVNDPNEMTPNELEEGFAFFSCL